MRCWCCPRDSIRSGRDTSDTMRIGTLVRLIEHGRGRRCRQYKRAGRIAGLRLSESCQGWLRPPDRQMPRSSEKRHGCFRKLRRAPSAEGRCPLGSDEYLVADPRRILLWAGFGRGCVKTRSSIVGAERRSPAGVTANFRSRAGRHGRAHEETVLHRCSKLEFSHSLGPKRTVAFRCHAFTALDSPSR